MRETYFYSIASLVNIKEDKNETKRIRKKTKYNI